MDQTAVGSPIHPCSGIDASDPQPSQITLPCTSIPVGVPEGFEHGFVRPAKEPMPCAVHPFGQFQDFLVSSAGFPPTLNSCHFTLSCEPLSAGPSFFKLEVPVVYTQRPQLIDRIGYF